MKAPPLVRLKGVSVGFPAQGGSALPAVDSVDLDVNREEKVGLIGESGSGKSLTALAMVGLTPPSGRFIGGEVLVDGRNTLTMTAEEQRRIRGRRIGLVFQEAETALNPVMTIGSHFKEVLRTHRPAQGRQWRPSAQEHLDEVGLQPARTLKSYAHQLSGGQRQRVMIALALAPGPELLIADEPTSSLDLVTQARILLLLAETCKRRGVSLLLISHDLDVVASAVDRVVVMLAGRIVEEAPVAQMLDNPLHPYTRRIVESSRVDAPQQGELRGRRASNGIGCRYESACPVSVAGCLVEEPPLLDAGRGRRVRCPVVLGRSS